MKLARDVDRHASKLDVFIEAAAKMPRWPLRYNAASLGALLNAQRLHRA